MSNFSSPGGGSLRGGSRSGSPLRGVIAAAVTPLKLDFSVDAQAFPALLNFLAGRGCHGALLFGTTGEGPSFSYEERLPALNAALAVRQEHKDFQLLAGTGTPSLEETVKLTRAAFDLGYEGVVVLPPYYFRKVSDEGLFAWFSQVLQRAVPSGGALLGYHIPANTGIPFSIELLTRLKEAFPDRFAGLKDSSGDPDYARRLGECFGNELRIFTGNDRLFSAALDCQACGCITAAANLFSPEARQVWEAFLAGQVDIQAKAQERLSALRLAAEQYLPFPPFIKALLNELYHLPRWTVRPHLLPLAPDSPHSSIFD